MLGLVFEAISGKSYQQFVTEEIICPLELKHTGFYRMDSLPANTALGYTRDMTSGLLRTNIYNIPVIGCSDGGLFTCAKDLDTLWRAVFAACVLSEHTLQDFLKPQVVRGDGKSYGLGVYRCDKNGETAYYALGADFGVEFFTAYFPKLKITASALGNTEDSNPLLGALFSDIMEPHFPT
jgi:CubicO group peptidase (beta-lactamase class C family)